MDRTHTLKRLTTQNIPYSNIWHTFWFESRAYTAGAAAFRLRTAALRSPDRPSFAAAVMTAGANQSRRQRQRRQWAKRAQRLPRLCWCCECYYCVAEQRLRFRLRLATAQRRRRRRAVERRWRRRRWWMRWRRWKWNATDSPPHVSRSEPAQTPPQAQGLHWQPLQCCCCGGGGGCDGYCLARVRQRQTLHRFGLTERKRRSVCAAVSCCYCLLEDEREQNALGVCWKLSRPQPIGHCLQAPTQRQPKQSWICCPQRLLSRAHGLWH